MCCTDKNMYRVSSALVLRMLSVMLTVFLSVVVGNTQLLRKDFASGVLL